MSSTDGEHEAYRGNDGSLDSVFTQQSCVVTTTEDNPYWTVDLGERVTGGKEGGKLARRRPRRAPSPVV